MNYYDEIKDRLVNNELYAKVKDYSKEKYKVITYFEIGRLLYEAGSIYGEDIIGKYSKKLMCEVGKKYNKRTLFRMKKFYIVFRDEKVTTMLTQLTWSHYLLLLPLKDYNAIAYYIKISKKENLTQRELQNRIKSQEYERLDETTKLKLRNRSESKIEDFIKNPIIIKNTYYGEVISEKILQRLILEDIPHFLKELGDSFAFISNEYKIKVGDTYNYIDLLLYNIEFHCYVVIELKITPLRKEHIGQIEVYMHYIDCHLKTSSQDKTIGIIICKKGNQYIMEYCSDHRIICKTYHLT